MARSRANAAFHAGRSQLPLRAGSRRERAGTAPLDGLAGASDFFRFAMDLRL